MNGGTESFEAFLTSGLQRLQLDEEVFSGYVTGILESSEKDCSFEDHLESLLEVLQDAVPSDLPASTVEEVCRSVVTKWLSKLKTEEEEEEEKKQKARAALQAKISCPASAVAATPQSSTESSAAAMTEEERTKRQALLAQYNYESADNTDDSDEESTASARLDRALGIFENTNRQSVVQARQEQRDEMHAKHVAQVEQTKKAREKQLQQQRERKEKAKAKVQKRERRR